MADGITVYPSSSELSLCRKLALEIIRRDRALAISKAKYDSKHDNKHSLEEVHYFGKVGELVTSKVLGVPMSLNTDPSRDQGIDLFFVNPETRNRLSAQVKYNFYPFGDLYFYELRYFKANVATLVTPAGRPVDGFVFRGLIGRERFEKVSRRVDWGFGPRISVYQNQLSLPEWLIRPEPEKQITSRIPRDPDMTPYYEKYIVPRLRKEQAIRAKSLLRPPTKKQEGKP